MAQGQDPLPGPEALRIAQLDGRQIDGVDRQGGDVAAPVVGHDQRFSGEHFAAAVAEVLAANGFRVLLTDGASPTPVISYSVVVQGAAGAVNVTASHNPPTDNGFKVRDEHGGAIAPDGLARIEALIPSIEGVKHLALDKALAQGMVTYFDPAPAYLEQIDRLIDVQPIRDAGLTVLVDCMWGNGAGWFPRILEGGKTRVIEIHAGRIVQEAPLSAFLILNWQRDTDAALQLTAVDLDSRRDLLAAIMKSPGPFYQYADGSFFQDDTPFDEQVYLDTLDGVRIYEAHGRADFDALAGMFLNELGCDPL